MGRHPISECSRCGLRLDGLPGLTHEHAEVDAEKTLGFDQHGERRQGPALHLCDAAPRNAKRLRNLLLRRTRARAVLLQTLGKGHGAHLRSTDVSLTDGGSARQGAPVTFPDVPGPVLPADDCWRMTLPGSSTGDLAKRVGARVKELRQQLGWSQEELARRVGLTRWRISQIEDGKWDVTERLAAFAAALDVPLAALMMAESEAELLASAILTLSPADVRAIYQVTRRIAPDALPPLDDPE